jgi:hypothetical protein
MANRDDRANGKARLGTDQGCINFTQRFARDGAGFDDIDLIAFCCDEQDRLAAGLACEDHGFGNLIRCTARCICRLLCRAGFCPKFHRRDLK